MTPDLADRLQACYTGAVHDVVRAMGHPNCVLPHSIRPLDPARRVAGPAFTLGGHVDQMLDPHETLLRWTGFLSRAPAGAVVVCQPHAPGIALMGELSAETLQRRGVRGYVVDGGCRDTEFILRLGFPVFCSFLTPADIVGRWTPDRMGEPITVGGVTVRTGDYVLGDRDGVICIPQEIAAEAVARTEEVMRTESLVRKAILDGMDPQEAYRAYGKF